MSWPYQDSAKAVGTSCAWLVCAGTITVRCYPRLWRTLDDDLTSVLEEDGQETWLCFNHENLLKIARKRPELKVRRSREGWVWVDTLNYLLFST